MRKLELPTTTIPWSEIGQVVSGKIHSFQETAMGRLVKLLNTDNELVVVSCPLRLADYLDLVSIGDFVHIEYLGEIDRGEDKFAMKDFAVSIESNEDEDESETPNEDPF